MTLEQLIDNYQFNMTIALGFLLIAYAYFYQKTKDGGSKSNSKTIEKQKD